MVSLLYYGIQEEKLTTNHLLFEAQVDSGKLNHHMILIIPTNKDLLYYNTDINQDL